MLEVLPGENPAGLYRAWYYIPTSYEVVTGDWANIFQFKHGYLDGNGVWNHEPQWWVNLTEARTWGLGTNQPALVVNCYDCGGVASTARLAPKGRWFQIEADVYNADRIVWKLDGQPWFTGTQSMARGIGLDNPTSTGWAFGVGHYGGQGKLWVDDASFTPR